MEVRGGLQQNIVDTDVGGRLAGWYLPGGGEGHVLVTEFRGMTLNCLFCADMLWPLDLVPPH